MMKMPKFTDIAHMTSRCPGTGRALRTAAAAVVSAVLLTSCAAHNAGPSAHPAANTGQGGRSVITLGSDGQVWTLAAKVISVRGAGTWQHLSSPVKPAAGDSVVVRGKLALVASIAGTTLTLAVSRDGGRTWMTSKARLRMPATGAYIALAPDTKHWAVGPASSASAGGVSQYSYGFVNTAHGMLTEVPVPGSMANLAWTGSGMIVPGGPADSHLYLSTNLGQSWRNVSHAALGFTPPAADIPATEPVLGPVLGLSSGAAIVPVERTGHKGLSIRLEATTTGTSYTTAGAAHVGGSYGAGPIAIASSSYGPDKAVLVLPGTMSLYVVSSHGKPVIIHMSGLPASPDSISFQDTANGIAQATTRSCANGKSNCTVTISQYVTSDGGRTWTSSRA
jgi:hypothetical protein